MKKLLFCTIALVLALSLAACDFSMIGEMETPSDVEVGGVDAPDNKSESGENSEGAGHPQPSQTEVAIEQTVLLNEAGVKITAKSLSMDEILGPEIKLLIENNSGKDLTVQCRNASVNGYMVDTLMSVDVANGKKANDSITFMSADLEACGITDIADMEFSFHIYTSADWETYLDTDRIRLKTSISDTYTYTYDDRGKVAYNADGIKVIIKGLAEDSSILGPSIVVYIENNTSGAFTVQTRDVSVNGFMIDGIFSCDVMPGKKAVDSITFMDFDIEENGITNIENVELSFHVFHTETWNSIVDTNVVKITF